MADKKNTTPAYLDSAESEITLRRKAEEALQQRHADQSPRTPEDAQHLLHELEVHQIELEMQNDELRRAQVELEASRMRYFELYDLAPVGYLTLGEQGLILKANFMAAAELGVEKSSLVGQPLTRFIAPESQDSYYLFRRKLFETGEPQICELRLVKKDNPQFWVRLEATLAQAADALPYAGS